MTKRTLTLCSLFLLVSSFLFPLIVSFFKFFQKKSRTFGINQKFGMPSVFRQFLMQLTLWHIQRRTLLHIQQRLKTLVM